MDGNQRQKDIAFYLRSGRVHHTTVEIQTSGHVLNSTPHAGLVDFKLERRRVVRVGFIPAFRLLDFSPAAGARFHIPIGSYPCCVECRQVPG